MRWNNIYFSSELSVSLIEGNLSEHISKNVAKCIQMFAVKTEQQLETGSEAAQVIGKFTKIWWTVF